MHFMVSGTSWRSTKAGFEFRAIKPYIKKAVQYLNCFFYIFLKATYSFTICLITLMISSAFGLLK